MAKNISLEEHQQFQHEVLDYKFDWSNWLDSGDVIVGHNIDIYPVGLQNQGDALVDTNDQVVVFLQGGGKGITYKVSCTVSTQQGRTATRFFKLKVHY